MAPALELRETGGTRGLAMVSDLEEAPPTLLASTMINASYEVPSYRVTVDDRTGRSPQLINSIDQMLRSHPRKRQCQAPPQISATSSHT